MTSENNIREEKSLYNIIYNKYSGGRPIKASSARFLVLFFNLLISCVPS